MISRSDVEKIRDELAELLDNPPFYDELIDRLRDIRIQLNKTIGEIKAGDLHIGEVFTFAGVKYYRARVDRDLPGSRIYGCRSDNLNGIVVLGVDDRVVRFW